MTVTHPAPTDVLPAPTGEPEPSATPTSVAPALRAAAARVAPLWPLDRFVAVNPYVGLADLRFTEAATLLSSVAGVQTLRSGGEYHDAFEGGRFTRGDVAEALTLTGPELDLDADELLASAATLTQPDAPAVRTVAEVAAAATGTDWGRLRVDRVSAWAAAHLDEGQALWRRPDPRPLFAAWKHDATIDRTPEVMGLRRFRPVVRSLPDDPFDAAAVALARLGVPPGATERYAHALLLRVGGWAAYLARTSFERSLAGDDDDSVVHLVAVLLAWELAILDSLGDTPSADGCVRDLWRAAVRQLVGEATEAAAPERVVTGLTALQTALELGEQRRLAAAIPADASGDELLRRPTVQAVFCIDVRSEVLRRHLEAQRDDLDTLGFAGFFGIAVEVVPVGHDRGRAQCPVLLRPSLSVAETTGALTGLPDAAEHRRLAHHVRRAWKSFKMGAISCFSFVGPVGLIYLPKLFRDDRGWGRPVPDPAVEGLRPHDHDRRRPSLEAASLPAGPDVTGIPAATQVELAESALRGMSLTSGFARIVLLAGHGATTVNNPYDSGLDCGACGGHSGEVNARLAVALLNDVDVREGLAARGIDIPHDTWFVAGLHDTTTDVVTLFDTDLVPDERRSDLHGLEHALAEAGARARLERAPRLGIDRTDDVHDEVLRRSTDWAQVRPEWGLAGCRAFIAAPRHRTRGVDLGGRAFLHSYDWRADEGFGVLELILTAPVVVASWINLQYYASTVDNDTWGSGNKTLHNVVGRLGVLEGHAGDLRVGLPWQSVHDGEQLQHDPLRLTVVVEAPTSAISDTLDAHPEVRALFDNGWLHLLAMDDSGRIAHRYAGDLEWAPFAA